MVDGLETPVFNPFSSLSLDKNKKNIDVVDIDLVVKKKNQKKKSDSSDVPAFPFESESKDEKKSKKSKSIKEGKKSDSNSMKSECQNIEGEKVKKSDENNFPTLKMDEKDNLRQKLEEKSKKYQHLPVYDKDEEKRLAESRTEKINQIFSDVDKDLEKVTDLTSTHMENKGIKMKSTDYNQIETNLHTINYKSGVLKNRRSAEQTQAEWITGFFQKKRLTLKDTLGLEPAPSFELGANPNIAKKPH